MKRFILSLLCTLLAVGLVIGIVWAAFYNPMILAWFGLGLFVITIFFVFYIEVFKNL